MAKVILCNLRLEAELYGEYGAHRCTQQASLKAERKKYGA